jgi:flavin-dependent dehydrogenase
MNEHPYDVIVVGGGPAGSTASNLLAQSGAKVLLIEKETFPRFHIGESLLPCGLRIYARLGIDMGQQHLVKRGAEFIDERTNQEAIYQFDDALPSESRFAYQVDRASFDHELMAAAKRAGAEVHEGERVTDYDVTARGVAVTTDRGSYSARFLVDATGQDAMFCKRNRTRDPLQGLGKAAVFCHFEGLDLEASRDLFETGNIKVLMVDEGWSWVIPLRRGALSVGLVSRKAPLRAELLDELIANSPTLQRLTKGAERRSAPRMIGNFSFRNTQPYGARWACIGDAACFLDPVFSSGVSLAVMGGERMADLLVAALAEHREADPQLMASLHAHMMRAYESVGALIHSFYNTRIVQNLFFIDQPDPELRAGLISLLAGDVWRDDNRFQDLLLRSKRRSGGLSFEPDQAPG